MFEVNFDRFGSWEDYEYEQERQRYFEEKEEWEAEEADRMYDDRGCDW